jgi:hypothetical protein
MQTQNNGLESLLLHFFFLAKSNSIVNSIISISATHAFRKKTNLNATNNNSCAL